MRLDTPDLASTLAHPTGFRGCKQPRPPAAELGFTSVKSYTQYVQSLGETNRGLHCAEVLASYLIWGE